MSSHENSGTAVPDEKGHLSPSPETTTPYVGSSTLNDVRDATDEEIQRLRHVVDRLPRKVWIALLASGAERLTYYVISTPWRKCRITERWNKPC